MAINADAEEYHAHFDAGCGLAVDLISKEEHDFGEIGRASCRERV